MKYINKFLALICFVCLFSSCEDYLDKTIETDLTVEEVFKNFDNAQGFTEEMYAMIVDYQTSSHWQTYPCYGDDVVGPETWMFDYACDKGEYRKWSSQNSYFSPGTYTLNTNADYPMERAAVWQSSWAGIRKANIILANAEEYMVDATQQEIDAVIGQAYFFRGFFHHEIMKFWGRMPYIDKVLVDDWKIARPDTWAESALRIAEDMDKAKALLPTDWDDASWAPGAKSTGSNQFKITKGACLAIKGKTLLYAASPLMQDSDDTYGYDADLCAQAAETFAELMNMPRYVLTPWANYEDVFYSNSGAYPYSSEYILSQSGNVGWWFQFVCDVWNMGALSGTNSTNSPTHNYIQQNFGMSDGLSCEDSPLYDPTNPWANRDPRFYKFIVVDGDQMVSNLGAASGDNAVHRYAEFQNGGEHRTTTSGYGSMTGYLSKKWFSLTSNKFDNSRCQSWWNHVRLTDVYLMYAEAALMAYGKDGKASNSNLTAVDAVNMVRERAVADKSLNVNEKYLVSDEAFMDEIRRERGMEMCYESHRWMDLRRWKIATQMKYRLKTAIDFDRNLDGKPINITERVVRTKVFEEKHYWLPLMKDDAELYEEFPQNPGW